VRARRTEIGLFRLLAALALAATAAPAALAAPPSKHIAKIMAGADGSSPETAYKVSSVRDEYEIVAALGLDVKSQALVLRGKAYDVLEVTDAHGAARRIWFDINSFYPEF
jgi:Domain of unknown function (DUF4919)